MIRVLQVAGVVAASLLLAACASGTGYSDLDREATEADVLPTELPDDATENWDADSVRFVGEHDDVRYYVARRMDPSGTCVLSYASTTDWFGACGGALGVTGRGGGRTVVLAPDGSEELESGVRVGENVAVTG